MKCLAAAIALSLCATTASAATYTYTYSMANSAVAFDPAEPLGSGDPFIAHVYDGGNYFPLFQFALAHDGPLDGITLQLANLDLQPLGGDNWNNAIGWLSFSGTQVAAWDAYTDADINGQFWGYSYHHHSDQRVIDDWMFSATLNPDGLPTMHYGVTYTEPSSYHFQTKPGRWSCLVDGTPCDMVVEAPVSAPVPASLALLVSGLAGMAWAGRRRK